MLKKITENDSGLQKDEIKVYDGSYAPMVIPNNLKTSRSIKRALGRMAERLAWLKNRVSEIQVIWNNPSIPPSDKVGLDSEHEKYVAEVPKLRDKKTMLEKVIPSVEDKERTEQKKVAFEPIEF